MLHVYFIFSLHNKNMEEDLCYRCNKSIDPDQFTSSQLYSNGAQGVNEFVVINDDKLCYAEASRKMLIDRTLSSHLNLKDDRPIVCDMCFHLLKDKLKRMQDQANFEKNLYDKHESLEHSDMQSEKELDAEILRVIILKNKFIF